MKKLVLIIGIIIVILIVFLGYQITTKITNHSTRNHNNNTINKNIAPNNEYNLQNVFYTSDQIMNRSTDQVTMTIRKETLTKTSATIMIIDHNIPPYTYNEWFRIDKRIDGNWQEETKLVNEDGWLNYTFTEEAIFTNPDGTLELDTNWTNLYGELNKGFYRLVKKLDSHYFYLEFSIE